MTAIPALQKDHGATFRERGGRRLVANFGRPERAHRAVRNVVGVIEAGYGVVVVTGEDRHSFVDDAVSNLVPPADGAGCYAVLCEPDGTIETDMYVYNAGERLLLFTPPGEAHSLVADWREKVFIEDVALAVATDEFAVFGVHGPSATEKIASVGPGGAPEAPLTFVRGEIGDAGATVIRTDGPAGEESFEVVCEAGEAGEIFDTLVNRGLNAAPFGLDTWASLTLEAGTPLFDAELQGRIPNAVGLHNAVDFEKGCFVGQEVISRIENRGRPPERLVGLTCAERPEAQAAVMAGDAAVGTVTRAVDSPLLEAPIAFAAVEFELPAHEDLSVRVEGADVAAEFVDLPFVVGSARSARVPEYPE
jgi:aminomethyltransferase